MRARLPYICVWQREPSRECLRPESLSYSSKLARNSEPPVDIKKIVLLGLAAVALILGGLGIALARHWPFSREIAHHAGQEGKVASLALSVRDGGVQDVLRLFVRGATRPYTVSPAFALT